MSSITSKDYLVMPLNSASLKSSSSNNYSSWLISKSTLFDSSHEVFTYQGTLCPRKNNTAGMEKVMWRWGRVSNKTVLLVLAVLLLMGMQLREVEVGIMSEFLYSAGIAICSATAVSAVIATFILRFSKTRLNKQLNTEYGSRRH